MWSDRGGVGAKGRGGRRTRGEGNWQQEQRVIWAQEEMKRGLGLTVFSGALAIAVVLPFAPAFYLDLHLRSALCHGRQIRHEMLGGRNDWLTAW